MAGKAGALRRDEMHSSSGGKGALIAAALGKRLLAGKDVLQ